MIHIPKFLFEKTIFGFKFTIYYPRSSEENRILFDKWMDSNFSSELHVDFWNKYIYEFRINLNHRWLKLSDKFNYSNFRSIGWIHPLDVYSQIKYELYWKKFEKEFPLPIISAKFIF